MSFWRSEENAYFLNPAFSETRKKELEELFHWGNTQVSGHIFLATSGTMSSGRVYWVALKKDCFFHSAASVNAHLKVTASDRWLHVLPDFHVGGLSIHARAFLSKSEVIRLASWDPELFVKRASEATLSALVPTQVYDLVIRGHRAPSCLRAILVGGGACSSALYQKALDLGWPLLPTYGMTEACSQVATARLEALGNPELEVLPHLQVRTCNEGTLEIKGTSLLTGIFFWKEGIPVFEDPKKEGWYLSSDRGEVLGSQLAVHGRSGECLKIAGEKIQMQALRSVLQSICLEEGVFHPMELVAMKDDRWGYAIHLWVEPGIPEDQLQKILQEYGGQVLGLERIQQVHVISELPRNALGKLIVSQIEGGIL
jgi:O-succinylbenzoic acid--CoA ligase